MTPIHTVNEYNENNPKHQKLNEIYLRILDRDVDSAGIRSYIDFIDDAKGVARIESALYSSQEYIQKRKKINQHKSSFDSMSGDRKSYISNIDTKIFDASPIGLHIDNIIKQMVLLDCKHYSSQKLKNRIQTVKESLIYIGKNNLPFSVFPHKEYFYNTDALETNLRNIDNFKYYILYLTLANIWKTIFGKVVATCGTKEFIQKIIKTNCSNFNELYKILCDYTTNYFAIKNCGHTLSNEDNEKLCNFILEERSDLYFDYIHSIGTKYRDTENKIILHNISQQTKKLGRKPKVLIMVAYLETQNRYFIEKALYHANKVIEKNHNLLDIDLAFDNERVGKEPTDYTPWSRVKRIRNLMIEKYPIHDYDYLYIIDSDIIDYPHDFLIRAIGLNPDGITAPLALIQNSNTFYDWCGYQKLGATNPNGEYKPYLMDKSCKERNFNLQPPYTHSKDRLEEIDCVGCTYVVPTYVFKNGYGNEQKDLLYVFNLAKVSNHKITENIVQYEDHPTFTDHYTICMATRSNGAKIILDKGSSAYHADLPLFGENWH